MQLAAASPFPFPYGRNCFYAPAICGVALRWDSLYYASSVAAVHSRQRPKALRARPMQLLSLSAMGGTNPKRFTPLKDSNSRRFV